MRGTKFWWDSFKLKRHNIRDRFEIHAVTDEVVELRLRVFNVIPEGRIIADTYSVIIDSL
jgi:hypothetical protein